MARGIAALIAQTESALRACNDENASVFADRLSDARLAFLDVVKFVCANTKSVPNVVFSGSVPYLFLGGILVAGWQLGRSMLTALKCMAEGTDPDFMQSKIRIARFFAEHILTRTAGLRESILFGGTVVGEMPAELL
ncbi:protein of unknown function [Georgfuchsia toluolica]|uniref:Acetyl-CoA dehydrogenase-like C-terminal domain-containing protein n=1 Tax=Georgfuchsia toluolica TaxID=424218 RepID=A0A916J9G6_9PROT|nr:acyl-CoA dehydrogenase C-terminal domain-containing protein [Georgfuchsia toluolica]CAG4884811.1 protein of unknown function [Georgfuchsia toluolica]